MAYVMQVAVPEHYVIPRDCLAVPDNDGYDVAFVRLDYPVGEITGGLRFNTSSAMTVTRVELAGYSYDKPGMTSDPNCRVSIPKTIGLNNGRKLNTDCRATWGASGSPLLGKDGTVYGIAESILAGRPPHIDDGIKYYPQERTHATFAGPNLLAAWNAFSVGTLSGEQKTVGNLTILRFPFQPDIVDFNAQIAALREQPAPSSP